MPGEFAAVPLWDAFPWVLRAGQFPGLAVPSCIRVLALYTLLEAEAVVGPVPTSPQKEKSQKKTHGIFLIVFRA